MPSTDGVEILNTTKDIKKRYKQLENEAKVTKANFLQRSSSHVHIKPLHTNNISSHASLVSTISNKQYVMNACQLFGIPISTGSVPDMDYLVERLIEKMKKDMEDYYTKYCGAKKEETLVNSKQRKKVNSNEASDGDNENSASETSEADIGVWLSVKSKYKMLRRKAQDRLVEYISDETCFKNYNVKLSYDHLEKMDEDYDKLMEGVEDNPQKIDMPINYLMRKRLEKDNNAANSKDSNSINVRQQQMAREIQWNKGEEEKYKYSIKNSKPHLVNKVPSATFKDIGFKEIYLALRKRSNLHNLRKFILGKIKDGQWLNDKELRYLTYSSKLTYKVLDKEYYNQVLNTISPEVKDDIISSIANDILTEYLSIREIISKARNEYIKNKTKGDRERVGKYMAKLAQENESLVNIVGLKKWKQTNSRYCLKRVAYWEESNNNKENHLKEAEERGGAYHKIQRSKSSQLIDQRNKTELQKMMNLRRQQNRNEFLRRNLVKLVNSNELGLMHVKDLRHLQNPASKVIKMPEAQYHENAVYRDEQAALVMQTMYDYKKLGMRESSKEEIERYRRLYSCGPYARRKEKKALGKEKAARLIQKVWRGYFERKMLAYIKSLPNKRTLNLFNDKRLLKNNKQSKYFTNLMIEKATLINPQNQQRLINKQMVDNKYKNQRDFNKRIDKQIREKIMKKSLKSFASPIERLMKSGFLDKIKDEIEELEEEEETQANNNPEKKRSGYSKNNLHIKQTALLAACRENKKNFLKNSTYNYSKEDVNIQDQKGNTSLYYACTHQNIQMITFLLKKGSLVNKKCSGGNTSLHASFLSKKLEVTDEDLFLQCNIIKMLVERGGDLDALNNQFQTPIAFGCHRLLKLLYLFEGKSQFDSKDHQLQSGFRRHNNDLFKNKCEVVKKQQMALYEFKRCSSASTMSSAPVVQHFKADRLESLYERREKFVQTEEYMKFMMEKGESLGLPVPVPKAISYAKK